MSAAPHDAERHRMSRWGRRVLALGTCVALIAAAAFVALRSGMAARVLREQALARLRSSFALADLDRVELTPAGTVVLHGLRIGDEAQASVKLPLVRISLAPLGLLRGRLMLSRVVVDDPAIRIIRSAGRWTLPALTDGSSAALPIEIDSLRVRGGELTIAFEDEPVHRVVLADLRMRARARADGERQELHIDGLRFASQGIDVSPLRLRGAVHRRVEGPICVKDLRIVSDRSRIVTTGCVDPGRSIDARFAVGPLDPAELRALVPASPIRIPVKGAIDARGTWEEPRIGLVADVGAAGTLRGDGAIALGAGPPAWRGRIAFAGLDPEAVVGPGPSPTSRAHLTGRTVFRGVGWDAAVHLSGRVVLGPSVIRGEPVEAAWIRGRHDARRTSVKARVDTEAGRAAVVADAVRGDEAAYDGRAHVQLRQAERLIPAASGSASARITIQGAGSDPRTGPATVRALVRDLTLGGTKIAVARARAQVKNGTVRVQELTVQGPELEAKGAGVVQLATRAVDATAQARIALANLGSTGTPPLRGSLSAQVEVRGTPDDFDVRLRAEGREIGGQVGSLASSLATHSAGNLTVGLSTMQLLAEGRHLGGAGATLAVVASGTEVRVGSVARPAARIEADWRQGQPADRTHLIVTAGPGEAATDRLRATVRRRAGSAEVDVEELLLTPAPDVALALRQPARAVVAEDHVRIVSLEFGPVSNEQGNAALVERVSLDGSFGFGGHTDGRLTIEALDLAPLCLAGHLGACQGRVAGRLRITGSAAAPEITGSIGTSNLVIEAVDCGVLEVAVDARAAGVRLAGALRPPAGEPLEFDARVPVDLSWTGSGRDTSWMPLSVVLRSDGLDLHLLGALIPGDVRDAGGRLLLDLRVDGTRAAPRFAGSAQLMGGWIKPAAAATVYSDVEATVIAEDEHLRLVGLRARSGDGRLEGDGAIDLDGGGRFGALALDLRFTDFVAVRKQTMEAAIGGTVRLRGRPEAPVLTGALDITRLALRPVAIEALSSAPLPQPDATIEIAGAPEPPPAEPGKDGRAALDPLDVALDLRLTRDAWIRSPEAEIELGGTLRIEKAPYGVAQVTGTIVLLRGWYAFQGRRFNVKQGTISLAEGGGEPQLDVTGVYRVRGTGVAPGYDIFVTVRGPGSAPKLTLASEPALEEGDILSVLLFGKTMDELTAGQATGLQQQTMRLAGQYVIGELGGSVRDGLGLDTLEVELPEGEEDTGQVTVGRHVTRDVLVSVGHEFGSTVAEVFGVEYGITPSISVRGSTTTDGRSAVDLFWRRRY